MQFFQRGLFIIDTTSVSLTSLFLSLSLCCLSVFLSVAREKNQKSRGYFDEDDDEPASLIHSHSVSCPDLSDDPLDAFMAQNEQQIQKQNLEISQCPTVLPEIVSGLDSLSDDEELEINRVRGLFCLSILLILMSTEPES